jgi:hypothetical protein
MTLPPVFENSHSTLPRRIGPQSHSGKSVGIIQKPVCIGQLDGTSEGFKAIIKTNQDRTLRRADTFNCNSELARHFSALVPAGITRHHVTDYQLGQQPFNLLPGVRAGQ